MTAAWYSRPEGRRWRCEPPSGDPQPFHASLPGYRLTELTEVPALADSSVVVVLSTEGNT